MSNSPAQPGLADRLRDVVVSIRSDLDISRHTFRAGPSYVVRDPITFMSHRFDSEDYFVLNAIQGDRMLSEVFTQLVETDILEQEDEESFYEFVLDLHQRSLLSLPINDADTLFQRFERRRRAENFGRILGVLFMKVPIFNPSQTLSRTLPLFRWLFTLPGFIAWCLLMIAAGSVVIARADSLSSPALAMLDGNNVFMLFASLIGLKVVHEFGHAYACKAFGGYVPEMGVFLMLFTPMAYVDATDSWGFSKTHHRAIVTLGGVYFESIVGSIAVFIWGFTEPSALNTVAYQVMILSTVTTALFNLNPLLRYDAYYLVSDLSGIPNLRTRCQEAVANLFKRMVLGIKINSEGDQITLQPGLFLFGMAQMGYRGVVMITISTVLIMKFGTAGIVIAIVLNGLTLVKGAVGILKYVISSAEAAAVRFRAISITAGVMLIAGFGVTMLPIPHQINAKGVILFQQVSAIRASAPGILLELSAEVGEHRNPGDSIAVIQNDEFRSRLAGLESDTLIGQDHMHLASLSSPGDAIVELLSNSKVQALRDQAAQDIQSLDVLAPSQGRVLELVVPHAGVHVQRGDPILIFGSGEVEGVFHVNAVEFQASRLQVGDLMTCRSPAQPGIDIVGKVTRIGEVAQRSIDPRISRVAPKGLVPMSSSNGEVIDAYVEVSIQLPQMYAELAGSQIHAQLETQPITFGLALERRVKRFLNRVKQSSSK